MLHQIGKYFLFLSQVFSKPEKWSVMWRAILTEIESLGLGSLGIIAIISAFLGAVVTLQTASNIDSAWIPAYTVGFTTRQSVILEFAPTIISLILAGKIGSSIASEIGTMRVTEQIDALEIMGINPANHLVLPKIIAAVLINPFLIVISMFLSIFAGYLLVVATSVIPPSEYTYGVLYDFKTFSIVYALIKTVVFAFIITSVPAFFGYFSTGGAVEVGKSSTKAVVYASIVLLFSNYILTQLLLI